MLDQSPCHIAETGFLVGKWIDYQIVQTRVSFFRDHSRTVCEGFFHKRHDSSLVLKLIALGILHGWKLLASGWVDEEVVRICRVEQLFGESCVLADSA